MMRWWTQSDHPWPSKPVVRIPFMYSTHASSLDRFTLVPHLVSSLCHCSSWCDCHGMQAWPSTVLSEPSLELLWNTPLRAWRFFKWAGARRFTDLSSVLFARKSHARRIPVSKRSWSSLGGLLPQWVPSTRCLLQSCLARPPFLVWSPLSPSEYNVFFPRPPSLCWSEQTRPLLRTWSCRDIEWCLGIDELERFVWHSLANGGSRIEVDEEGHSWQRRSGTPIAKDYGWKSARGWAQKILRFVCGHRSSRTHWRLSRMCGACIAWMSNKAI